MWLSLAQGDGGAHAVEVVDLLLQGRDLLVHHLDFLLHLGDLGRAGNFALGLGHLFILGDGALHVAEVATQDADIAVDGGQLSLGGLLVDALLGDLGFETLDAGPVIGHDLPGGLGAGDDALGVFLDVLAHYLEALGGGGVFAAALIEVIVSAHGHAAGTNTRGDHAGRSVAGAAEHAAS